MFYLDVLKHLQDGVHQNCLRNESWVCGCCIVTMQWLTQHSPYRNSWASSIFYWFSNYLIHQIYHKVTFLFPMWKLLKKEKDFRKLQRSFRIWHRNWTSEKRNTRIGSTSGRMLKSLCSIRRRSHWREYLWLIGSYSIQELYILNFVKNTVQKDQAL